VLELDPGVLTDVDTPEQLAALATATTGRRGA
jgi:hypothetical protein